MKNFYQISRFVLVVLLLSSFATAKSQFWSEPQSLTSSPANHVNPNMNFNYEEDEWLLVWEQSTDSISTAIYCQNDLSNGEPVSLLSDTLVHYRNPQSFYVGLISDTLYYIFYERVNDANTELFYIKLAADGGHSNPILFSINYENDLKYKVDDQKVAWVSNGLLQVSFADYNNGNVDFTPPDTLTEGNISDLVINSNYVFWILNDDGQDKIMSSFWDWDDEVWSLPGEVISGVEIQSLETVHNHYFNWTFPLIAWTYRENDLWYITNYEGFEWPGYFDTLNISRGEPFDFGIFCEEMITDPDYGTYCMAFSQEDSFGSEIFVVDENFGSETPFQLSHLGTESKNPLIVQGESFGYGYWVYIVWEAKLDGYWQFYYSRAQFYLGSVEENNLFEEINISPNPATDFIHLQNSKELEISIRIFDATGKLVFQSQEKKPEISINTQNWPRGMYLLNVLNEEKKMTTKLIFE